MSQRISADCFFFRFQGTLRSRHCTDLILLGRGHPHEQTSTPDRADDLASRVGAHDDPDIGRVFLHRPTERGLGISGECVGFVDDDDCGMGGISVILVRSRFKKQA